jgi:hypothetical protein
MYLLIVCSPLYRLPAVFIYDTLSCSGLGSYVYIPVILYRLTDIYFRSNDDPDAWSLIGNLHLAKMEWGPAQVST